MLRYEALMLAIPEITQDEARSVESQLEGVIKAAGASTVSFERWGKYRLAYPVNKNEYGVYFLMRFEANEVGTVLKDVQNIFAVRLNDIVMRHMVSRLESVGSLEYHRPHSLEEAPPKEVGGYMGRENRMDRDDRPHKPSRDMGNDDDSFEDEEA